MQGTRRLLSLVACLALALASSVSAEDSQCPGKPPADWRPSNDELNALQAAHVTWITSNGNVGCQAQLERANLRGANLTGANLRGANLRGADLRGTPLGNANLSGANLLEANLSGANLSGANLLEANLTGANLFEANFSRADLLKANLSRANLGRANLSGAFLRGANLSGTRLFNANLSGAKMSGANLSRADLLEADLSRADLGEANLSGADLFNANLSGADLPKADLSGAILFDANLSRANLRGAYLSRARLLRTELSGATLDDADLAKAFLDYALLWNVNFEPSSVEGIRGMERAEGLSTLQFTRTPTALVLVRDDFRERGLHAQAGELTYAIRRQQRAYAWQDWGTAVEAAFDYGAFEVTSGYGLYHGRPLRILGVLIPLFGVIYMFALVFPDHRGGIWRVWGPDRILKREGQSEPIRLSSSIERWQGGQKRSTAYRTLRVLALGMYLSILSAFHIGWRDLNVGTWIARLQPGEFTLRTTGWVRFVSGLQFLASVYLLALWVLTYFGRPFD